MTLAAIAFGVSGLILSGGFVADILHQLGEATIHSQTGHIQVFRKDFLLRGARQPDKFMIDDPTRLRDEISNMSGVSDIAMRLNFSGLLNNGKRDLPIIGEGVEADKEVGLSSYLEMSAGRQLSGADPFGMIVGEGVAHALSVKPGDTVTLVMNTSEGAVNTLDFEITGVFRSFSKDFDARAVRIPISAAQELLATPGVNLLVVTLDETKQTDNALNSIRSRLDPSTLDALDWKRLSDFYEKTVALYDSQFGVLQLIILVMVLLSVANTVNMSVFERLSEFGTMLAVGNQKRQIFHLIVVENAVLGFFGAILGVGIGLILGMIISAVGISMPPPPNANVGYTALIRIVPSALLYAFVIGIVATTLAALLPARRVSSTPIVDALRQSS